jgi:hypothetical protein
MNINRIQSAPTYGNQQTDAGSQMDASQLKRQNQEAAQAGLGPEAARAVQDAFEVNLSTTGSQEASGAVPPPQEAQSSSPDTPETDQPFKTSQIVNIVA